MFVTKVIDKVTVQKRLYTIHHLACGFWQFNGSFLQDTNYITLVQKVIDEIVVIKKNGNATVTLGYSERPDSG